MGQLSLCTGNVKLLNQAVKKLIRSPLSVVLSINIFSRRNKYCERIRGASLIITSLGGHLIQCLFSLAGLGVRGDLVSVKKSLGRNRLLPRGLAVYASPENKKLFEEEKLVSRGT